MLTTCKQNLGVAPWRQKFSSLNFFLLWCSSRYGTAVEHGSLLNRPGICDGIICCNIFVVHTAVLNIKTFNLVKKKIHLLFRIMLLIQGSVNFCRPSYRFWETEIYTPSVFRIYADIHGWRTNGNLCNKLIP